jgi:hypothetical protein
MLLMMCIYCENHMKHKHTAWAKRDGFPTQVTHTVAALIHSEVRSHEVSSTESQSYTQWRETSVDPHAYAISHSRT